MTGLSYPRTHIQTVEFPGHAEIQQNKIGLMQTHLLQCLLPIFSNQDLIPTHAEVTPQNSLNRWLIINDENSLSFCFHAGSPMSSWTRRNAPAFSPDSP